MTMLPLGAIRVTAVPTSANQAVFMLECSECGPMEIAVEASVKVLSLAHLKGHGVDISPFLGDPEP